MSTKCRGAFLSERLHGKFLEYLRTNRQKAPPAGDLDELLCTFSTGAHCDRKALQGKFKSWAKRMSLLGGDTLMLGSKLIVPRERFADIAWAFHASNAEHHLSVSEVVFKVQTVYTWGQKDFGMIWEVVQLTCAACPKPECQGKRATSSTICGGSSKGTRRAKAQSKGLGKFLPPWLMKSIKALKTAMDTCITTYVGTTDVERRILKCALKPATEHRDLVAEIEGAIKCSEATSTKKELDPPSPDTNDTKERSCGTSGDKGAPKAEPSEGTLSRLLVPHLYDPISSDHLLEILCILGSDEIPDDGFEEDDSWGDGNRTPSTCGPLKDLETPGENAKVSNDDDSVWTKDMEQGPQCSSKLLHDVYQLRAFFPVGGKRPTLARCDYLRSRLDNILDEVSRLKAQLEPLE